MTDKLTVNCSKYDNLPHNIEIVYYCDVTLSYLYESSRLSTSRGTLKTNVC